MTLHVYHVYLGAGPATVIHRSIKKRAGLCELSLHGFPYLRLPTHSVILTQLPSSTALVSHPCPALCISRSPASGLPCPTQVLPTDRTACSTLMSLRSLFSHFQTEGGCLVILSSPVPAASPQTPGLRA